MRQASIKSLVSIAQRDFFGIHDITSKDIAGAYSNLKRLPHQTLSDKYTPLTGRRTRLVNEEADENVIFGRVRYDVDNITQKHGQFEEDNNKERLYDTVAIKQMFVPEDGEPKSRDNDSSIEVGALESPSIGNKPYRISEVEAIKDLNEVLAIFKSQEDHRKVVSKYAKKPPLTFYFEGASGPSQSSKEESVEQIKSMDGAHSGLKLSPKQTLNDKNESLSGRRTRLVNEKAVKNVNSGRVRHDVDDIAQKYGQIEEGNKDNREKLHDTVTSEQMFVPEDNELESQFNDTSIKVEAHELPEIDSKPYRISEMEAIKGLDEPVKPMKALDYLKKVRAKKIEPTAEALKKSLDNSENPYPLRPLIKLDSRGFRNYTNQVPDWSSIRRIDVINHIKSSIIYNNYDILALNKPYGIASHENNRGRELYDVNGIMSEVAKSLRIEKVYLAHRLDKTTTGVLLFATSKEMAERLNKLFRIGDIKKTYWCITKGVPDPPRGILDMPIGEIEVSGKLRGCPAPVNLADDKQLAKRFREARRAITEYEVINNTRYASLVEVKPQTGVKHQIRCHLGFGLKTPILGDHKYSHLTKLAPQKLPPILLNAFHLRQSKVRTLPMHLHAKSIVIPNAKANGETLFINAPLPKHFVDNLKTLKLSKGLDNI